MKTKQLRKKIVIVVIFIIAMIVMTKVVLADFNVADYTNIAKDISGESKITSKFSGILNSIQLIGSLASVVLLIIIGIKYMISSVEERAEYKNTMAAYIIGAVFIFGISKVLSLIRIIGAEITNNESVYDAGNSIVTILSVVGSLISVVVLAVLGIKYMSGSTEAKAEYKKTLLPYLIGAMIIFAASTIAGVVFDLVNQVVV